MNRDCPLIKEKGDLSLREASVPVQGKKRGGGLSHLRSASRGELRLPLLLGGVVCLLHLSPEKDTAAKCGGKNQ